MICKTEEAYDEMLARKRDLGNQNQLRGLQDYQQRVDVDQFDRPKAILGRKNRWVFNESGIISIN